MKTQRWTPGTWTLTAADPRAGRVGTPSLALQQLIGYLHPAAGGFTVSLPPSLVLIERLRGIGRTSIDLDSQVLIEDDLVILAGTPHRPRPAAEEEYLTAPSSTCAIDNLPATPPGHEVRLEYQSGPPLGGVRHMGDFRQIEAAELAVIYPAWGMWSQVRGSGGE